MHLRRSTRGAARARRQRDRAVARARRSRTTRPRGCPCPTRTGSRRSRCCSKRPGRSSTSRPTRSTSRRSKPWSRRRRRAPSRTTPPPGCRCPTTSTTSRRSRRCSTPTPTCRPRSSPRPRRSWPTPWPPPRPRSAPSPARAEPHDAAAWLPLPLDHELPAVTDLLEEATPPPVDPPGQARPRRAGAPGAGHRPAGRGDRAGRRLGRHQPPRPRPARRSRSWSTAPASEMRTEAASVGALLKAEARHARARRRRGAGGGRRAARRPPRRRPALVPGHRRRRRHRPHRPHGRDLGRRSRRAAPPRQAHRGAQPARSARGRRHRGLPHAHQRIAQDRQPDGHVRLAVAHRRRAAAVYNVTLGGDDFVVPALGTVLADGASVTVVRVGADGHPGDAADPVRHRAAGRPRPPDRSDPRGATGQERHHGRHLPPAGRERREGRPRGPLRGAVGGSRCRRSSATAPTPIRTGTSWRRASRVAAGTPSTPRPTATTAASASTAAPGGRTAAPSSRPNAGLATREQQIIVGMRIYADLGWDPWGCANNVLHWPQWSM